MQWLETCDQELFKKYTLPGQENLTDRKDLHKMLKASFLKDEFSGLYDKAGTSISRMLLPANNFLKDPAEIESELQKEINNRIAKPSAVNIIPIEIALLSPREENY